MQFSILDKDNVSQIFAFIVKHGRILIPERIGAKHLNAVTLK
jgi:hypothetical protein